MKYDIESYQKTGLKLTKQQWMAAEAMCELMCPCPEEEEYDRTEEILGNCIKADTRE